MIEAILKYIITNLHTAFPGLQTIELCEKIKEEDGDKDKEFPGFYDGKGNAQPIELDHYKSLIYFRQTSEVSIEKKPDESVACGYMEQRKTPLKLIAWFPKDIYSTDNEYISNKLAENILSVIQFKNNKQLANAMSADSVKVLANSYNVVSEEIINSEYSNIDIHIPFDKVYLSIAFDIIISGTLDCFINWGCNDEDIMLIKTCAENLCNGDTVYSLQDILNLIAAGGGGGGEMNQETISKVITAATDASTVIGDGTKIYKRYSLQVNRNSGAATWVVYIQISQDNVKWTTVATHTELDPADGQSQSTVNDLPALYIRAYCDTYTGGGSATAYLTAIS